MSRNATLIPHNSTFSIRVPQEKNGIRIDLFLAEQFEGYSRSFFQKAIDTQCVKINNAIITKHSHILKENDVVEVLFPEVKRTPLTKIIDTELGASVLFEHPDFLIVFKPAGLVVHPPSPLHPEVSLVDWLLEHFQEIGTVGYQDRPGIVHRLDKETSGLLIIPRNSISHELFSDKFKNRKIKKTYLAIVEGHPEKTGSIDFPINRDPFVRTKMSHEAPNGRESLTHYTVLEYFKDSALVQVNPVTGRTHQIRVHFKAIGHPLIGDRTYGHASKLINRHALHATRLEFEYNAEQFDISAPIPDDLKNLIATLKKEIE